MGNGWLRPFVRLRWAFAAVLILSMARLSAAVVCTESTGAPPRLTTVRLDVQDPSGDTTVPPLGACSQRLDITGTWSITGPQSVYDVYIVIDQSGSTELDSGVDVDGDGIFGEDPDDSIFYAEIQAGIEFVRAADPAYINVAIVSFNRDGILWWDLSPDMATAETVLDSMKDDQPRWDTQYVQGMDRVDVTVIAHGNRFTRKQLCLFLSDGQPDDPMTEIQNKAQRMDDITVVLDTFALGFTNSTALEEMSRITGGTFTPLAVPGDIVDILPGLVPVGPGSFTSRNDTTGTVGSATLDESDGTFSASVTLMPGVNHVVLRLESDTRPPIAVECAIDVTMPETLVANAGAGQVVCAGSRVTLDASASAFAGCADPIFEWYDCIGALVCPPSSSPTCEIIGCSSPCRAYRLRLTCAGETCESIAMTRVDCMAGTGSTPRVVSTCGLRAFLTCGGTGTSYWWDFDLDVDANGDGDPTNDVDADTCDVSVTFPTGGLQRVYSWTYDSARACSVGDELRFDVLPLPPPRDLDGGVCPMQPVDFDCGTLDPSATYWWDFKGAIDSDGDGDPTRDHDTEGCITSVTWPVPGTHEIHCWKLDENDCESLVAYGIIVVGAGAIPGEVPDVRVARTGAGVDLRWGPVPGASSYRVARGTIDCLWTRRTYDHSADPMANQGTCDTGAAREFHDFDDADIPGSFYYLVTSTIACGGEGLPGDAWDGHIYIPRPPRIPSADCP